ALLHAPIVSPAYDSTLVHKNRSNRNAAFVGPGARFVQRRLHEFIHGSSFLVERRLVVTFQQHGSQEEIRSPKKKIEYKTREPPSCVAKSIRASQSTRAKSL